MTNLYFFVEMRVAVPWDKTEKYADCMDIAHELKIKPGDTYEDVIAGLTPVIKGLVEEAQKRKPSGVFGVN